MESLGDQLCWRNSVSRRSNKHCGLTGLVIPICPLLDSTELKRINSWSWIPNPTCVCKTLRTPACLGMSLQCFHKLLFKNLQMKLILVGKPSLSRPLNLANESVNGFSRHCKINTHKSLHSTPLYGPIKSTRQLPSYELLAHLPRHQG